MRGKKVLAICLSIILLTGCSPERTEPVTEEPTVEGAAIAYVPLDDRPDNEERVIYLAESLGYALEMPERDLYHTALNGQPLNANGTQSGNRASLYEWLLDQEEAGCDRYVISMDQLLSGGLVNSRAMTEAEDIFLSDGTSLTEETLLENLLEMLASDANNRVWLLDSVMRLAPTVGYQNWTLEEYNALRAYGAQPRRELPESGGVDAVTLGYRLNSEGKEIPLAEFDLEEWEVEKYLSARSRKLNLADQMLRLRNDTMNDGLDRNWDTDHIRVLIGVDDSSEANSIQKPEIDYLRSLLRDGDALLSGVDDLAFKAVSKLYLEEIAWDGAKISVDYYGDTENRPACAYDYKPLEEIVEEHIDFFGLSRAENADAADIRVLVLTQPENTDEKAKASYYGALIKEYNQCRKNLQPVILIDAGNGQYGNLFHQELTEKVDLGWLLSYAGFLDMAIVTGTAMSHGVARYAFLKEGQQTDATERAFVRTVADSILKDFCYKNIVREDILNYVRGPLAGNADNFWEPKLDLSDVEARLEAGMKAHTPEVIANLERSNFISSLAPYAERGWGGIELTNYRFPWDRAFEIGVDINLGEFTEAHKDILGVYYK